MSGLSPTRHSPVKIPAVQIPDPEIGGEMLTIHEHPLHVAEDQTCGPLTNQNHMPLDIPHNLVLSPTGPTNHFCRCSWKMGTNNHPKLLKPSLTCISVPSGPNVAIGTNHLVSQEFNFPTPNENLSIPWPGKDFLTLGKHADKDPYQYKGPTVTVIDIHGLLVLPSYLKNLPTTNVRRLLSCPAESFGWGKWAIPLAHLLRYGIIAPHVSLTEGDFCFVPDGHPILMFFEDVVWDQHHIPTQRCLTMSQSMAEGNYKFGTTSFWFLAALICFNSIVLFGAASSVVISKHGYEERKCVNENDIYHFLHMLYYTPGKAYSSVVEGEMSHIYYAEPGSYDCPYVVPYQDTDDFWSIAIYPNEWNYCCVGSASVSTTRQNCWLENPFHFTKTQLPTLSMTPSNTSEPSVSVSLAGSPTISLGVSGTVFATLTNYSITPKDSSGTLHKQTVSISLNCSNSISTMLTLSSDLQSSSLLPPSSLTVGASSNSYSFESTHSRSFAQLASDFCFNLSDLPLDHSFCADTIIRDVGSAGPLFAQKKVEDISFESPFADALRDALSNKAVIAGVVTVFVLKLTNTADPGVVFFASLFSTVFFAMFTRVDMKRKFKIIGAVWYANLAAAVHSLWSLPFIFVLKDRYTKPDEVGSFVFKTPKKWHRKDDYSEDADPDDKCILDELGLQKENRYTPASGAARVLTDSACYVESPEECRKELTADNPRSTLIVTGIRFLEGKPSHYGHRLCRAMASSADSRSADIFRATHLAGLFALAVLSCPIVGEDALTHVDAIVAAMFARGQDLSIADCIPGAAFNSSFGDFTFDDPVVRWNVAEAYTTLHVEEVRFVASGPQGRCDGFGTILSKSLRKDGNRMVIAFTRVKDASDVWETGANCYLPSEIESLPKEETQLPPPGVYLSLGLSPQSPEVGDHYAMVPDGRYYLGRLMRLNSPSSEKRPCTLRGRTKGYNCSFRVDVKQTDIWVYIAKGIVYDVTGLIMSCDNDLTCPFAIKLPYAAMKWSKDQLLAYSSNYRLVKDIRKVLGYPDCSNRGCLDKNLTKRFIQSIPTKSDPLAIEYDVIVSGVQTYPLVRPEERTRPLQTYTLMDPNAGKFGSRYSDSLPCNQNMPTERDAVLEFQHCSIVRGNSLDWCNIYRGPTLVSTCVGSRRTPTAIPMFKDQIEIEPESMVGSAHLRGMRTVCVAQFHQIVVAGLDFCSLTDLFQNLTHINCLKDCKLGSTGLTCFEGNVFSISEIPPATQIVFTNVTMTEVGERPEPEVFAPPKDGGFTIEGAGAIVGSFTDGISGAFKAMVEGPAKFASALTAPLGSSGVSPVLIIVIIALIGLVVVGIILYMKTRAGYATLKTID